MRQKKVNEKKRKKGIVLSILFTLIVPIGFVFVMGLFSQAFPMLYFYTKAIFLVFILLCIVGFMLIAYHLFQYFKLETNHENGTRKKRKLKKLKLHKKPIKMDSITS